MWGHVPSGSMHRDRSIVVVVRGHGGGGLGHGRGGCCTMPRKQPSLGWRGEGDAVGTVHTRVIAFPWDTSANKPSRVQVSTYDSTVAREPRKKPGTPCWR